MAHAGAGRAPTCDPGPSRWPARTHRRRRGNPLRRRQIEKDRPRLSCPDRRPATGHVLPVQRAARRRRRRSSGPCAPRRADGRGSPSPASATRARQPSAANTRRPAGERRGATSTSTTTSARRRRRTRRRASSASSPCSTCSTATCATPIWPRIACAPGRTSGTTTAAARATGRGCRRPAITRTSSATARSATRPTRPISPCPRRRGRPRLTRGLWYAFTAGSVRVISLANDDVCYQDSGDSYVRGYSAGAQKAWLEKELAATRANRDIDWIVVCMHQVAISTCERGNGADLGIREEWAPLFDRYGVDLVVCGHEHHYERSHPIRGHEANATLTPVPAATDPAVIDTSGGTVHMVIGGGGTSAPSNGYLFDPPRCRVVTAVGPPVRRAWPASPGLCHRGRAMVGGTQRGSRLWLRGLHGRPGRSLAASPRSRSPTTTWSGQAARSRRSRPSNCAGRAGISGVAGGLEPDDHRNRVAPSLLVRQRPSQGWLVGSLVGVCLCGIIIDHRRGGVEPALFC